MKDALAILGKDDDVVSSLFQDLAPPALPTDRVLPHVGMLTLQAVRCPQGAHQYSEDEVHAHRPRRFLGRMLEAPLLLALFDTAMLDQPAVIIVVEGLQGLVHWGIGQEDRFPPWAILVTVPRAYDHGVDGGGLEVPAVVISPMRWRPILVIGRQRCNAHDFRLPPFGPGGFPLAMADGVHPASHGDASAGSGLGPGVQSNQ
jgi:hypothetical protein